MMAKMQEVDLIIMIHKLAINIKKIEIIGL